MKIDQHEPKLVHPAAEVLAGQPVRELVRGRREEGDRQKRQNRRQPVQPGKVVDDVAPVGGRRAHGHQNDGAANHEETRREEAAQAWHQAVEQTVRVGDLDPQVQQAAAKPPLSPPPPASLAGPRAPRFVPFQETGVLQVPDERAEALARKGGPELLLRPLPDHLEGRFPVALPRNELLRLAKPKEIAGERVLDDDAKPAGRPLLADGQIAAKAWRIRNHKATRMTKKAAGDGPTAFWPTAAIAPSYEL